MRNTVMHTLDQLSPIFILITDKVNMRTHLNEKWISIREWITPCKIKSRVRQINLTNMHL